MKFTKFEYTPTKCFVCGEDNTELLYKLEDKYKEGPLTFVRCKNDGLIYQNPVPTPETLQSFFNTSSFVSKENTDEAEELTGYQDYLSGEEFRKRMSQERLDDLNKRFGQKKPLDILKIAPGTGIFLKLAQDFGHKVLGVDVSEFFVNYARKNHKVEMILSPWETADLGGKNFDVILLFGAILNFRDPKAVLTKIHKHLKPDGELHINYSSADSWWVKLRGSNHFLFRPPVITFFNKKNFEQILRDTGFNVEVHKKEPQFTHLAKLAYFSKVKPFIKFVEFLNLKKFIVKIPVPGAYYVIAKKK